MKKQAYYSSIIAIVICFCFLSCNTIKASMAVVNKHSKAQIDGKEGEAASFNELGGRKSKRDFYAACDHTYNMCR